MSGQGQIKGTLQMENLCWYCKHAVPRMDRNGNYTCGCEWSLHRAPVAGWEAELTFKTGAGMAWAIYYCPQYVNDALPDIAPWHGTTTAGAHTLAKHNWDKHGVDIFPNADPWGDKCKRTVKAHWRIKDRTPEEHAVYKEIRKKQMSEARKTWGKAHPEKDKTYQKRYRDAHREEINRKAREKYRAEHPEKPKADPKTRHELYELHKAARQAYQREYYQKNREAIKERHRQYYEKRKDHFKEKNHRYYLEHKDYYREKLKEYRALKKGGAECTKNAVNAESESKPVTAAEC